MGVQVASTIAITTTMKIVRHKEVECWGMQAELLR